MQLIIGYVLGLKTGIDPNGTPVPARGAVLPAEYKLYDDPDFPFICPIRSCRRTLPNLFALGGHFNAGHSHVQVHDNLDGTFTQVGKYTNTTGSHPCIVVSQGPPPPGALPPVEPRLPDTLHKNKRHLPYVGGGSAKRQMIRTSTQIRAAQRQGELEAIVARNEPPEPVDIDSDLKQILRRNRSRSSNRWNKHDSLLIFQVGRL